MSNKRDELAAILKNAAMSKEDAARAVAIVRETDGTEFARKYAEDFICRAKESLPKDLPNNIREAFIEAADFIAERNY